jgi:metal-dependent hydrolase (beta-lactamase superfamily II)
LASKNALPIPASNIEYKKDAGLIVITGCAHPGIVEITATAKNLRNDKIRLILT